MGESFLDKNGGGFDVNGLIEDYYAYAGENINAGSFVEFVNGIASTTTETSSDTKVSSATYSGRTLSAIALDNNRVFVAHGYGTGNYLYGIVVTVNGTIITYGTDTQLIANSECSKVISAKLLSNGNVFIAHSYLNGSNYCLYGIVCKISGTTITKGTDTAISSVTNAINDVSVELLDSGNVFISHSAGSNYYLYGIICSISDITIAVGTDTAIVSDSNSGKTISTTLLPDGRIFIAHSNETRLYLYGIICTVSGTTITMGTDTKLSSTYSTGEIISAKLLSSGNVFIAHSYTTSYYLYGIICAISGATITIGTDTAIYESEHAGYYGLDVILLKNGDIFVVFNDEENRRELYGTVVSINGTTIAVGTATQMVATIYAGYAISALLLPNDTIFVAHNWSNDYYRLYAQIFGITDNIPTNNVVIPTYETQVRNVTSSNANGIAKTSGVGGDSTGHNEQIQVYVPKTVTYTGDIIPKSWTAITEGTEYISSDGTILSANGTDNETWSVDKACDGNTGTLVRFLSNNRTWIKLKFHKAIKITKMSLWRGNTASTDTTYIQGSNNDTDWNILYTINEFADSQGVQELNVDLNNPDYYLYYRIYIPEAATNFIYEWQTTEYEVIE